MSLPEHFEVVEGIAYYRPVAKGSHQEATALLVRAIEACHEIGVRKILVDARGLTGFTGPNTFERYEIAEQLAKAAKGVVGAFVLRPEMFDPDQFGPLVAANRGAKGRDFLSEADALKWLREQNA